MASASFVSDSYSVGDAMQLVSPGGDKLLPLCKTLCSVASGQQLNQDCCSTSSAVEGFDTRSAESQTLQRVALDAFAALVTTSMAQNGMASPGKASIDCSTCLW